MRSASEILRLRQTDGVAFCAFLLIVLSPPVLLWYGQTEAAAGAGAGLALGFNFLAYLVRRCSSRVAERPRTLLGGSFIDQAAIAGSFSFGAIVGRLAAAPGALDDDTADARRWMVNLVWPLVGGGLAVALRAFFPSEAAIETRIVAQTDIER